MAATGILVSGATLLYSNVGTALPNINSVAFGAYGSWSGWTSLGVTASPVRPARSLEFYRFDSQQHADPYDIRLIGKNSTLRFEISQITGAALALLLGGTHTPTSASSGVKALSTIDYGSDFTTTIRQWAFEGFRLDDDDVKQPVRWFIYKAAVMLEGDMSFNKRDHTRLMCTLMPIVDTSKSQGSDVGKIQIVTGPATS